MSILRDAHDVIISGGDFRIQNICQHGSTGIDVLRESSTPEAAVDSEEREYAPSCYPGTRNQYIDDITKWATARSDDNIQPIYWMKGPAGVGKSAIAQTCATKLKDMGQLGAAFFFSINGRRKDHTRFFPTLAYQLSTIHHDYRKIVNRKVSVDQTLVKKAMVSQFKSLIVEPLQELKEQGRELQRSAIFIDGLDECESQDAQVEIIRTIVSSIRTGSTPFRWAIFSREEPHIVSTFADPNISSHCYSVFLPISRKTDEEIELYLRGGFRNILQRRNLLNLLSSWPTEGEIRKLVDTAAGLFAHPAIVLRFIDRHSYSGFQESLQAVLVSISKPDTNATSLYAELDKLYTLILQRVPGDLLSTMFLLLSHMVCEGFSSAGWTIAGSCNVLDISATVFWSIYHHLQAILMVRDPPQFTVDQAIALERSYYDQDSTFKPSPSLDGQLWEVYGAVTFHHKSFYDFIIDPSRSSTFCVTTTAARGKLLNCYVHQHSRYASSYSIQGSTLVRAPGKLNSSGSLSWSQGTEFVDSFLKLWSLLGISYAVSPVDTWFGPLLRDLPLSSLRKLVEIDYRKFFIANKIFNGLGRGVDADMIGYHKIGDSLQTDRSIFQRIGKNKYDDFDPVAFLRMIEELEKVGIIRPYSPHFGSSRSATLLHVFSRQKPYGRSYGQYKLGRGDKSVVWYWEFDTEERYFHEFQTMNFSEAMAYYKAKKFKIWE